MIPFRKRKPIFTAEEAGKIVNAIQAAEKLTSGEIRLFVERKCKYVDALDRAKQVFDNLEMEKTEMRNGVLFYLAMHDHQLAIFADKGIHEAVEKKFWARTLQRVIDGIRSEDTIKGICDGIGEIGAALQNHFPYQQGIDKNELPDEIVFGK